MNIPIIDENQALANIQLQNNPFFKDYSAFYSSWFGGIIKNPRMLLLPMDDHMVHRGDGVFEGIKIIEKSIYLLDEHLKRLFTSAEKISLKSPYSFDDIKNIVIETARAANQAEGMIRIFLSRGPGNFSVNPYDSIKPQLYVVIHKLVQPSAEKYKLGAIIGKSSIPVKTSLMSQIKSCNYLPNVLMKKEAVDRHLDFVIGIDIEGYVTESATENIMIVDHNDTIIHPPLDYILKGITMIRACELAREHGFNTKMQPVSIENLKSAREVMITGTSLNVLPVVKYENCEIGNGKPGPITTKLLNLMLNDIKTGAKSTNYA